MRASLDMGPCNSKKLNKGVDTHLGAKVGSGQKRKPSMMLSN